MALIQSTAIPSGATDYELEQSLRFNDDDSAHLTKTFASAGNRRTWTFSCWLKRGAVSGNPNLFRGTTEDSVISLNSNNFLGFYDYIAPVDYGFNTAQVFRDASAWYHIVAVMDTTNSTSTDRMKIYVNGQRITSFSDDYGQPALNWEGNFNKAGKHNIGFREHSSVDGYYDGYLAEVNFIDGQALTPVDFGETGDYGEWKPIEYEGTYGTNGFYLPFKQDYTVEGFSTVVAPVNAVTQYIGGTGFKPDLTWIKIRDRDASHSIFDSVRGGTASLMSDDTDGDRTNEGNISFDTDGYSITSTHPRISGDSGSGHNSVAWNWDMSNPASNVGSTGIQFDNSDDDIVFELGTALGTGSFTVEYWTYFDSLQNYDTIFSTTRSTTGFNSGTDANGMAVWYSVGDDRILESASGTYATGQWYHTAYVRNGTTLKVYVNGVEKDSATDNNDYSEQTASVGALDGASEFSGIILDSLRVSNVARYTSNNFETPQARFTSDSNTLFLLNAPSESSTTLTDSSSNSLSLTITGTSVVSPSGSKPAFTNTNGSITSTVRANPTYGQSIVTWTGNATAGASVGTGLSSAAELIIIKNRETNGTNWRVHDNISGKTNGRMDLNGTGAENTANHQITFQSDKWTFNNDSGQHEDWNKNNTNMLAYCFHSVTGYSKFGTYDGDGTYDGSNVVNVGFTPAFVMIKCTNDAESWLIFDNARNPLNSGDDPKRIQANSSAAEITGGSTGSDWVELTSTGFKMTGQGGGSNGNGNTYIYMAFADKREYAYWLDQSGNNNDWTSNNLTESDISVDSPTNNFATLNPLNATGNLAEGNLKGMPDDNRSIQATFSVPTGKWYWECLVSSGQPSIGIVDEKLATNENYVVDASGCFYYYDGRVFLNNSTTSTGITYTSGDILSFTFDASNNQFKIYKNNSLVTTKTLTSDIIYTPSVGAGSANPPVYYNFGQDSSFASNKTAQGNQDGNDIGDFYYAPPTGFLALCTKNLPDVDVVPSEHFNTVLYTGNQGTNLSITGVGFEPSLVWGKNRSSSSNHWLFDAVRGTTKMLSSDGDSAEETQSGVTAFGSDGFTLGTWIGSTKTNDSYVAWNWKANGSGSSNTDGTINTTSTSANVDAGFSIIEHSGNATANATIGHGLSKAPELVISKKREDNGYIWNVFVKELGTSHLRLDTTGAAANDWEGHEATTASVIQLSAASNASFNAVGKNVITYAWHSVDGYSKVGSYTGNGSTDGTFVYTGFRPAFLLMKVTNTASNWHIVDSARDVDNVIQNTIDPDTSNAEGSGSNRFDFTSNGFKLRQTSGSYNGNGSTYIYIAFAETPFKYSNAR